MSKVEINKSVTNFSLPGTGGTEFSLSKFLGKTVVLYFYPRDNTPGCTSQACNLTENYSELSKHGIKIIGVSPDSEAKHIKFINKYDIAFELLADEDKSVHMAYGVWAEKKFMGKVYDGTHRTTFLIDENSKIVEIIAKPKCKDHAAEILAGYNL